MAENDQARGDWWCAVPSCDAEVIVWSRQAVKVDGVKRDAMVPFCREHGPKVGGDV